MKRILTILAVLTATMAHAQQSAEARRDSLIHDAHTWTAMGNADHALHLLTLAGGDEAQFEIASLLYNQNRYSEAISECKKLIEAGGDYALDARVLMGQCRRAQGYDFAAKRIFKKALADGSSNAALEMAHMLYAKGRLTEAEHYAQQAIQLNVGNAEAHFTLASVMESRGLRFEAMMPLYYYLLISDNDAQRDLAYRLLTHLWCRSSTYVDLLHRGRPSTSAFNDAVNRQIDSWTTDDSPARAQGVEAIEKVYALTDSLFRHLLQNSENNLDFWQLTYTDFMVKLVSRNFVRPMAYHIASQTYKAEVLAYTAQDTYLYNEFSLWMEAQ